MYFKNVIKEMLWTGGSISNLDKNIFIDKDNIEKILKEYRNSSYVICQEYSQRNSSTPEYEVLISFNSLKEIDEKSPSIRKRFYVFEIKSIIQITKNSKYKKSVWIPCTWDEKTAKLSPKDFYGKDGSGQHIKL